MGWLKSWLQKRLFPAPADLPATIDQAKKSARRAGWNALPGGALEYGGSGWQIRFEPNSKEHDFALFDPEGFRRSRCSQGSLQELQLLAERFQAERDQFEVDGDAAPVWTREVKP